MKSGNGSETAKLERGESSSLISFIEYILDGGLKLMCSLGSKRIVAGRLAVAVAAMSKKGLILVNVGFNSVMEERTSVVAMFKKGVEGFIV